MIHLRVVWSGSSSEPPMANTEALLDPPTFAYSTDETTLRPAKLSNRCLVLNNRSSAIPNLVLTNLNLRETGTFSCFCCSLNDSAAIASDPAGPPINFRPSGIDALTRVCVTSQDPSNHDG